MHESRAFHQRPPVAKCQNRIEGPKSASCPLQNGCRRLLLLRFLLLGFVVAACPRSLMTWRLLHMGNPCAADQLNAATFFHRTCGHESNRCCAAVQAGPPQPIAHPTIASHRICCLCGLERRPRPGRDPVLDVPVVAQGLAALPAHLQLSGLQQHLTVHIRHHSHGFFLERAGESASWCMQNVRARTCLTSRGLVNDESLHHTALIDPKRQARRPDAKRTISESEP